MKTTFVCERCGITACAWPCKRRRFCSRKCASLSQSPEKLAALQAGAARRNRDPIYRERVGAMSREQWQFNPKMRLAHALHHSGREWPTTAKATTTPTTHDIAWAAGFIEGEGTFGSGSRVDVGQVNPEPLQKLLALFGGVIATLKADVANRRPSDIQKWRVCGSRGRGFIMTIYGFLSEKRKKQALFSLRSSSHERVA